MTSPANGTTAHFEAIATAFRTRAFLQKDFTALDEYLTSDFTDHFAPPWDPPGIAGVRQRFGQAAMAFDTTNVEVLHSISNGQVLMQAIWIHLRHTGDFMGLPATGKAIKIAGFDAFEFRGDKLAGHWGVYDVSRMPDLLGLTPGVQTDGPSASWAAMWNSDSAGGASRPAPGR